MILGSVWFFVILGSVWFFVTPWTAAGQASLSFTNCWSLLKLMPLSWRCHPTVSSSVTLFSSCPQSEIGHSDFVMMETEHPSTRSRNSWHQKGGMLIIFDFQNYLWSLFTKETFLILFPRSALRALNWTNHLRYHLPFPTRHVWLWFDYHLS